MHRQETILKRIGVDIPRATLSLWVIKCAELFLPILKLMHDRILTHNIAYADETTTQVLKEPNKDVQSKKYMWLFAGRPPEEFVYCYHYHPSRSHEVAVAFFEVGRKGWLFANSVAGANAAATIFSIIETCKHHKVEPYDYLRYALNALPQCQAIDDYEKLLPYNIDRSLLVASVS